MKAEQKKVSSNSNGNSFGEYKFKIVPNHEEENDQIKNMSLDN